MAAFPTPVAAFPPTAGDAAGVGWRKDGAELYYLAPDKRLMAVPVTSHADTRLMALSRCSR